PVRGPHDRDMVVAGGSAVVGLVRGQIEVAVRIRVGLGHAGPRLRVTVEIKGHQCAGGRLAVDKYLSGDGIGRVVAILVILARDKRQAAHQQQVASHRTPLVVRGSSRKGGELLGVTKLQAAESRQTSRGNTPRTSAATSKAKPQSRPRVVDRR